MRLLRDQDELLDLIDRAVANYITAEREHLDDALCCYCIVRKQPWHRESAVERPLFI